MGYLGGAGGGSSRFFNKPFWQNGLPGTARQSPDIAALADPYTGAVFVENGIPSAGIGGTSLACPIFSALWAIADQAAGTSLGQAAPILYRLPSTAIHDVIPVNSTTNVTGIVVDSNGETDYSSNDVLAPLYTTTRYYSALWNLGGGTYVDLSFGTDSSLTVTPGWDNVTGLGTPNGLAFITAVVSAKEVRRRPCREARPLGGRCGGSRSHDRANAGSSCWPCGQTTPAARRESHTRIRHESLRRQTPTHGAGVANSSRRVNAGGP